MVRTRKGHPNIFAFGLPVWVSLFEYLDSTIINNTADKGKDIMKSILAGNTAYCLIKKILGSHLVWDTPWDRKSVNNSAGLKMRKNYKGWLAN